MTKSHKQKFNSVYSIFNIILITLQSFMPGFFALMPTQAYAATQAISEIELDLNSDNEFELSIGSDSDVSYLYTYETGVTVKAIKGSANSNGETATSIDFAGTCSDEVCIEDEVTQGSIELPKNDYQSDFIVINNQLWLTDGNSSTVSTVAIDTVYSSPQNKGVQVTFTKLPENPGSLTIEEIELTEETAKEVRAYSRVAYDITSNMADGTFEYELKLPLPAGADEKAGMVYAESVEELSTATAVKTDSVEGKVVKATGLNHFTVFVVADPTGVINGTSCTVASILGTCYDDLQLAVDAAGPGDTIEIATDIALSERVEINATITLDGNGNTITTPFIGPGTSNSNNAALGISGTDIVIKDVIIDGIGGTSLHGINTFKADNVLLDNVTIINAKKSGLVVNGSTVTVNNITTAGNAWNGINIDQGSGVTEITTLTVNGVSSHSDAMHMKTDNPNPSVSVIDTNSQYNVYDLSPVLVYMLKDITGPEAPVIEFPVAEQYFNSTPILNDWSEVTDESGIDYYRIEYVYDDGHTFSGAPYRTMTASQRNHTPGIGEQGGVTIRVQAFDNEGNEGAWSEPVHYIYDATAPDAPTNLGFNSSFPNYSTEPVEVACGGYVNLNQVSHHWSTVDDAVSYQRQWVFPGQDPTVESNWHGAENWTTNYTNYRSFGGGGGTEGLWNVRVRAQDAAGNWSEYSDACEVTYDKTVPDAPTLIEPSDMSVVTGVTLLSDWTSVSDAHHYIYESYHDAGAVNLRWHAEYTSSEKSANNVANTMFWWRVKAVDAAGNESGWSDLWKVTIDNDAPDVSITNPGTGLVSGIVDFRGSITDTNPDHYYAVIKNSSNAVVAGPGVVNDTNSLIDQSIFSWDTTSFADGKYTIFLAARDAAGLRDAGSEDSVVVTVDNTVPVTTLTSPKAGDQTNQDILIEGSSSDLGIVDHVNLYYRVLGETDWTFIIAKNNGGNVQPFAFSHSWTPVGDASYDFKASGVDTAGNEENSAYVYGVIYDTVAPVLTWTNPTDDELVDGNVDLSVVCEGGDTESTYVNFWWWKSSEGQTIIDARDILPKQYNRVGRTSLNGGTVSGDTFGWTLNTGDEDIIQSAYNWTGEWKLRAACKDAAGNYAHAEIDMSVDNVKPTLTVTTPSADSAIAGAFTVEGAASDAGSDIKDIRVRFRNESNSALVETFWATYDDSTDTWILDVNDGTNDIVDGYYKVITRARDNSGNTKFVTVRRIYVDNINPESTITTFELDNGGETQTNEFYGLIEGTATDENSGLADVLLEIMYTPFGATESSYWSGTEWVNGQTNVSVQTGPTPWSYQLPEVSVLEGTYNVTSHALDNAGNLEETYTITIVYDKTIPEVVLTIDPTSPDGRNSWYITEPTITLTASDNYSLDHIEYQWNSTTGTWTTYTAPINPPSEGQNILYYRSIDTVGNISEIGLKEVKFDKTSPTDGSGNLRVKNIKSETADATWNEPANSDEIDRFVLVWKHEDGSTRSMTVAGDIHEAELFDLFNGEWKLTLESQDAAGNSYSVSEDFTVGGSSDSTASVLGATTDTTPTISGFGSVAGATTEDSATTDEEEKTEEAISEDEGSVAGTTDSTCSTWKFYLPIILLLLQAMFLLSMEIANREASSKKALMALGLSILTVGLFYILRDASCYSDGHWMSFMNKWFIAFSLGLAVILRLAASVSVEEK